MKKIYKVIESRGCGITYIDFTGSLSECRQYVKRMKVLQHEELDLEPYERTLYNGNDEPFDYYIE